MSQSTLAFAGNRLKLAPVVLATLVVGLAVALACLVVAVAHNASADDARASALSSARQAVVNFTSFDYRHLDQQFAVVDKETTGEFRQQFTAQRDTIRKRLVASRAATRSTIVDAALEASTSSEATAVVAMDQVITSGRLHQPVTSRQRVEVHLVRSGDRWLVDNVTAVG